MAKANPRVPMFIWFVFQDSQGSLWQSGLYRSNGTAKPAQSRWAASARPLDARNKKITVKGGRANRPWRSTCASSAPPARRASSSASTVRVRLNGKLVGVSQPAGPLQVNCTVTMPLPVKVAKKKTYVATLNLNTDAGGSRCARSRSSGSETRGQAGGSAGPIACTRAQPVVLACRRGQTGIVRLSMSLG